MEPKLFVSMSAYMAGRLMGAHEATDYFHKLIPLPDGQADEKFFPAVRSIRQLRLLADLELRLDTGATDIGKSISRHFSAALESSCAAWFNFDDDVETSPSTLAWMLAAVDFDTVQTEPRVCFAPYIFRANDLLKRQQALASVEWHPIYSTRAVAHAKHPHGQARACKRAATGLIVMNRLAMEKLAAHVGPTWNDDDGKAKYPVAYSIMEAGAWAGPDFSLCQRIEAAGIPMEALITGETIHQGLALDLGELAQT